MLFLARILAGVAGASVGTASAYIADITPPEESFEADRSDRRCFWNRVRSWSRDWWNPKPMVCHRAILVRRDPVGFKCDSDVDRSSGT